MTLETFGAESNSFARQEQAKERSLPELNTLMKEALAERYPDRVLDFRTELANFSEKFDYVEKKPVPGSNARFYSKETQRMLVGAAVWSFISRTEYMGRRAVGYEVFSERLKAEKDPEGRARLEMVDANFKAALAEVLSHIN